MMKRIILLICISLFSCTKEPNPQLYLTDIGIELADKYETIENENSFAIGESLVDFKIKISSKDYDSIARKIERVDWYTEIEGDNLPTSNPKQSIDEAWSKGWKWKRDSVYYYEVFKPNTTTGGWETYLLYLKPDKTIRFQYVEE